jgi:RNA-binding protein 5/10
LTSLPWRLFSAGLSKGFGFAQFASAEHARKFVEPFFPFVSVPPPASHGASATAIFNEALESGAPHNGRRVKIDYSQSANPADRGKPRNSNDGTRDIGPQPSPVLLLRGLDPLSGPGAITQAMNAAQGPGKEGGKGMRRIVLIKDKVTLASWGFAFVEFVDVAVSVYLLSFMSSCFTCLFPSIVGFSRSGSIDVSPNSSEWVPHLGSSGGRIFCADILVSACGSDAA